MVKSLDAGTSRGEYGAPMNGDQQPAVVSAIESTCNIASGFLLSLVIWQVVVAPLFGYAVTIQTNIALTSIFTVVSWLRSYAWRRFFANGLHRVLLRLFTRRA